MANYRDIVATRALAESMGRFGDTEIGEVRGVPAHLRPDEKENLDRGIEPEGSPTTNPWTGWDEYWSGGDLFSGLSGLAKEQEGGKGIFAAGKMLGEGSKLGGALGAVGSIAGPLAIGLQAFDWISGAMGKADAAKQQISKLETGISGIESERTDLSQTAIEGFENLYEGLGRGLTTMSSKVGQGLESVASGVGNILRKSKGLKTGTGELFEQKNVGDITEQFDMQKKELLAQTEGKIDQYGNQIQEEIGGMNLSIEDMTEQIAGLRGSTNWMSNLI